MKRESRESKNGREEKKPELRRKKRGDSSKKRESGKLKRKFCSSFLTTPTKRKLTCATF